MDTPCPGRPEARKSCQDAALRAYADRSLPSAKSLGRLCDLRAHRCPAWWLKLLCRQAACRWEAHCKRCHSIVVRSASPANPSSCPA